MKRLFPYILTICAAVLTAPAITDAETITDKALIEAFRQNPYRAAAGHAPYEEPSAQTYSAAPKGYRAFYISHYGRHGSRFQSSENVFESICPILDELKEEGLLTPCGDTLRMELHQMWKEHEKQMYGMLTHRGRREHQGIAERMYRRNPEVFEQKDRKAVSCRSTVVTRCVESMGNFAMTIGRLSPALDISMETDLLTGRTEGAPSHGDIRKHSKKAEEALFEKAGTIPTLASRLFTDPAEAAEHIKDGNVGKYLFNVFRAAAGAACLDMEFDPLRFFTPEELLICNRIRNIHFCSSYGCFGPTRDIAVGHARPYVALLIDEADRAIAGDGHCAHLRFAHDKQVGNILSLFDLDNYNVYTPTDQSHNHQAAWKYISMAVNLQLVFYSDGKGDILVKCLCNEKETAIPALNAVNGVYYRWSDLKEHLLRRIGTRQIS